MKNQEIKNKVNEKIVDYCVGIINIEDLIDYVHKIEPSIIFSPLMKSKRWGNLCQIMESIEDYELYKENGDENIFIERIKDYYNKIVNNPEYLKKH